MTKKRTMTPQVAPKARAGWRPASVAAATTSIAAPAAQMAESASMESWLTSVHTRKAMTSAAAGAATRAATARARCSTSPVVRRLRKIAPWVTKSARVARPPSSA